MIARGAAFEGRCDRVAMHQPPPVTARSREEHGRLRAGGLAKMIVDLVNDLRIDFVLEDDQARRDAVVPHLLKVEHTLLCDIAGINPDADLICFRVCSDHAQSVFQADALRIHQVTQEGRLTHARDEALHHFILSVLQAALERLSRAHHFVADGADGAKQLRIQELGRVVGGELPAAADVAGEQ